MKVIFMGTPAFSVPILDAIAAQHQIVAVYCQPPRPAGRGKADRPSPVQARAEALGLPVRHPSSLKSIDMAQEFSAFEADVAVVVAYGLILPQAILDAPRLGCLNIHASLLPRWRGAAPIHRAIMAGDPTTGVCIMRMEAGLDTGPVLLRSETAIAAQDTTQDLSDRLSRLGAETVLKVLDDLPGLRAEVQAATGVTYAEKINKSETRIDWSRSAVDVDRLIRGLSPFPGAWCDIAGERVKFLRSELGIGSGRPGQVLDRLTIACGTGAVRILQAQREGKRPTSADDFLRGFALPEQLAQS